MLSKAILVGRIGKDPEKKIAKNGSSYCRMRICCNHTWVNKDGEKQEVPYWFSISAFGKTADNCAQYLQRGSLVYVEGRLQSDKPEEGGWDRVEVVIDEIKFLARPRPRSEDEEGRAAAAAEGDQGPGLAPPADDDIPFAWVGPLLAAGAGLWPFVA